MRQIILALVVTTLLFACGQNTSQKELDLQKKELELKQKELELKEKELSKTGVAEPKQTDTVHQKSNITSALTISTLSTSGDLGQVTFSQNGKTIFYYNLQSKKGKIKLNNTEYVLDKFSSNSGSYTLSGGQVKIVAPNCKFDEGEGDCGYGKFSVVTITLGTEVLKLIKVSVQDCPNL